MHVKAQRKYCNTTPQMNYQRHQQSTPIERSVFQKHIFVIVDQLVTHHKSARLPIDLSHLDVLSHCYQRFLILIKYFSDQNVHHLCHDQKFAWLLNVMKQNQQRQIFYDAEGGIVTHGWLIHQSVIFFCFISLHAWKILSARFKNGFTCKSTLKA